MPVTTEMARARGRKNILKHWRPEHDPERVKASRDLAVLSVEEHIKRVVAQAPPLTPEQIAKIRA